MRCLSPFQQAYRDVAAQHGCILIDGQSYFHAIGRHGLLDDELFQDAMHPSLRGQIALAQAVLVALRTRRAFDWPANSAAPVIDPAECVAHFGIDMNTWLQMAMWWKGFNELMAPLRYDPSLRGQNAQPASPPWASSRPDSRPKRSDWPMSAFRAGPDSRQNARAGAGARHLALPGRLRHEAYQPCGSEAIDR